MQSFERNQGVGAVHLLPAQRQAVFWRYISGALDRELDGLTQQHGFGLLRIHQGMLGPRGSWRASP